jgi:predicted ATPase with chaperone activity
LAAADFGALVQQIIPDHTGTRSLLRCMKVARTLADLRQAEAINGDDVRQAWRWQSEPAARERGEDLRALGSISGTSSRSAIHS